jgi:hypothetical protein
MSLGRVGGSNCDLVVGTIQANQLEGVDVALENAPDREVAAADRAKQVEQTDRAVGLGAQPQAAVTQRQRGQKRTAFAQRGNIALRKCRPRVQFARPAPRRPLIGRRRSHDDRRPRRTMRGRCAFRYLR